MTSHAAVEPMAGLPWGTTPEGELDRQGTILGSIMGTYAVFVTLPLGILGIVLSCMGLDRIPRGDPSARRFLMWSWICFAPGTVLGVPLTLLLIVGLVRSIG